MEGFVIDKLSKKRSFLFAPLAGAVSLPGLTASAEAGYRIMALILLLTISLTTVSFTVNLCSKALANGVNPYLLRPSITCSSSMEKGQPTIPCRERQTDLAQRMIIKKDKAVKRIAFGYVWMAVWARNEAKVFTDRYQLRDVWSPGYIHQAPYPEVFSTRLWKLIDNNPNRTRLIITGPVWATGWGGGCKTLTYNQST